LFKFILFYAKPGYDNVRYYAIQITASQFLDKSCDASESITLSCNCEFAAVSLYISETVNVRAKVTRPIESE